MICALTSPPRSSWPRVVNGSVEIEAILNSRPMALLHANDTIEAIDLTPGHFIIEKPLKAPPCKEASNAQDYKPEEMDFGKSNSCRISAKGGWSATSSQDLNTPSGTRRAPTSSLVTSCFLKMRRCGTETGL